jgi:phenylalanyl-tRNA synthetase beta chain
MDLVSAKDYELVPSTEPFLHPGKSCDIILAGKKIGYFGEVHPDVQNNYAISGETYLLEIEVEPLMSQALTVPQYQSVPQFPSSSRDIAVVVPADVPEADLETVLRKNAGKLLTKIKLFDVYNGKQVAEGCKSMAFNLTFQDKAKTLVDADVDAIIKKVLADVESAFKAKLRD